jgi:hypothetical protein
MKIFNFYAIDFSCYNKTTIKSNLDLEHCKVTPLECNDKEEAKKLIKDDQVLVQIVKD